MDRRADVLLSSTITVWPKRRFRAGDLDVKMWRAKARLRAILPEPVILNRLAAPLWVFSFGIGVSFPAVPCPGGAPPGTLLMLAYSDGEAQSDRSAAAVTHPVEPAREAGSDKPKSGRERLTKRPESGSPSRRARGKGRQGQRLKHHEIEAERDTGGLRRVPPYERPVDGVA